MSGHYSLRCLASGSEFSDEGLPLGNPAAEIPAFLRAVYHDKRFQPGPVEHGIYRFANWLPIQRRLEGSSAPVTYQSEGLAEYLGLKRLFITFSGYWPERSAGMLTGTFKECEAFSVCARMPADYGHVLVVASAGNTARAFTRVCSDNNIPLVVVVPEPNLSNIWSIGPVSESVRIVAAGGDSDYTDAIILSGIIADLPGFAPEGGAKNVARRDGMGTTVLSAAHEIGEIPEHYFQAVGSGTGAIAAWEANLRLIESGMYGERKMRLHVSQNMPFVPIHDSWQIRSRDLVSIKDDEARVQISRINAKVLANRKPPYSLGGGLYDALVDTDGTTGAITNEAAAAAAELFAKLEGIDVAPAAAVAAAHLIAAVENGLVTKDEIIMLNVTGGGYERIRQDLDQRAVEPTRIIQREDFHPDRVRSIMAEIF
jgi:cysteate synthase